MKYSAITLDYFERRPHAGILPQDATVLIGEAASSSSQESLRVFVGLMGQRITQCGFQANNASVTSIAAAEFVAEWCEAKSLESALSLQAEQIMQALELPALKLHSALLAISALKNALEKRKI